jgi:hypothetical protein
MNEVSKLAVLQAIGAPTEAQREAYNKVIGLLQSNSPEAQLGKDGASQGLFVFRGTAHVYRAHFVAVPVFEHLVFVEWPSERAAGAFPLATHPTQPREVAPDSDGDWRMPNGNRVVRTRYLYIALANAKGEIDFADLWALPITSTGFRYFDAEFASQYPMTIKVDGPMSCCKWRFSTELASNNRGSWFRIVYTKGSVFGLPNGPPWDVMVRGAEIGAEMHKADALARQGAPQIEVRPQSIVTPTLTAAEAGKAAAAARAKGSQTVTSGRAAYDPGPPKPPPAPDEAGDGPGPDSEVRAPIALNRNAARTSPLDEEIPF